MAPVMAPTPDPLQPRPQVIALLAQPDNLGLLRALQRGIEKESLRVQPSGALSKRPHPAALGSPLTHPHITTDFSEAQLELITGVFPDIDACIAELREVHQFVYANMGNELLWPASMPCILGADADIPVGQYGSSNIGRAKTLYRLGLGVRYGRLMQTISGIHYNFSVPDALWPALATAVGTQPGQSFQTQQYFGLIRNFRRHSWLLILLLGASPSLCKSFAKDKAHRLQSFDEGSLYLPYATSLRMGRLGYQSDAQSSLHVSYNSLADYTRSLRHALTHEQPEYAAKGVRRGDEYLQLNANLLQIENEFYGTIRPKRRTETGERPISALHQRGVEYVEVRCLDLNPFLPLGIDADSIRFLDLFLLHCLLTPSPPDSAAEAADMAANQLLVVEEGRRPGLQLQRAGKPVALSDWGQALLTQIQPIAALLDNAHGGDDYQRVLTQQQANFSNLEHTPSARMLAQMRAQQLPFAHFVLALADAHKQALLHSPLSPQRQAAFAAMSAASLQAQREMEAADVLDFDSFLAQYLAVPELGLKPDASV